MNEETMPLEREPEIRDLIARALAEDVGAGDATTLALVDAGARASARIVARHELVVAGGAVAAEVFRMVDAGVAAECLAADGETARAGSAVMRS